MMKEKPLADTSKMLLCTVPSASGDEISTVSDLVRLRAIARRGALLRLLEQRGELERERSALDDDGGEAIEPAGELELPAHEIVNRELTVEIGPERPAAGVDASGDERDLVGAVTRVAVERGDDDAGSEPALDERGAERACRESG